MRNHPLIHASEHVEQQGCRGAHGSYAVLRVGLVMVLALAAPLAEGSLLAGISDIVFDRSGEHVYVATSAGLFVSNDGGASWNEPEALAEERVTAVTIDPSDARTVYAGTWMGLWRSEDRGMSWENDFTYPMQPVSAIVAGEDGSVWVSGTEGVHSRTDGSEAWTRLFGDGGEIQPPPLIAHDRKTGKLWIGSGPETPTTGLRWSADGGSTWNVARTEPVREVTIDPRSGHVYVLTDEELTISRDGGRTFNAVEVPEGGPTGLVLHSTAERSLFISTFNDALELRANSAIWRSDDEGKTWRLVNRASKLPTLVTHRGDALYVAVGPGIARLNDDGTVEAFALPIATAFRNARR